MKDPMVNGYNIMYCEIFQQQSIEYKIELKRMNREYHA